MKVLLDEDVPLKPRHHLPGHDGGTVSYAGWTGLKNGKLLGTAQESGFEVFMTADQSLSFEQNLKDRLLGVVVLSAPEWQIMVHNLPKIPAAVDRAMQGTLEVVECGRFQR